MIIPDKKKAVSVILKRATGDGPGVPLKPEMEMSEGDQVLHTIAQELMLGMEEKSASAVMRALRAFMAEIQTQDEMQDQSDGDDEL